MPVGSRAPPKTSRVWVPAPLTVRPVTRRPATSSSSRLAGALPGKANETQISRSAGLGRTPARVSAGPAVSGTSTGTSSLNVSPIPSARPRR